MRLPTCVLAALLAACPGGGRTADPAPPEVHADAATASPDAAAGRDIMQKDPNAAPATFTRGPAIAPAAELVAWLDAQRTDVGQRRVKLPVWLTVSGTSIKAARIGAADAPDAVALKLKDSALGISLADHARRACRGGGACGLWLEGKWGGDGRFDVTRVAGPFTAADDATYVEVQE